MLKIFSFVITCLMAISTSGMPQQPTTAIIPSYVVLPQMPSNLTPPPPGQPSSFSISQIRNRRAAANNTVFSSPPASYSSSMSSSEETMSKYNKKVSPGINSTNTSKKPQLHDESKLVDAGRAKIEAYSAPLAQLDLPGMMPPVTHRLMVNESHAEAMGSSTASVTSTIATTVANDDVKNTTHGSGH